MTAFKNVRIKFHNISIHFCTFNMCDVYNFMLTHLSLPLIRHIEHCFGCNVKALAFVVRILWDRYDPIHGSLKSFLPFYDN